MKRPNYFTIVFGVLVATAISVIGILGMTGVFNLSTGPVVSVQFRNYDDSVLFTSEIDYGKDAVYEEESVPTRPDEDNFAYIFSEWDKPLNNIKRDTVFVAQYFEEIKNIKVKFVNYDNTFLYEGLIYKGANAEYFGAKPERRSDEVYKYSFAGWDKSLNKVEEDSVFVAQYETTKIEYEVTFKNYDGTTLHVADVAYGEKAVFLGLTPLKPATKAVSYSFLNWDKNIDYVTGNIETYAVFKENPTVFAVDYTNYDGTVIYTDYVSYDGTSKYIGNVPTRESDGQFNYAFKGWNKPLANIRSNLTVVALFKKIFKTYAVTYYNYDHSVHFIDSVYYGENSRNLAIDPVRPPDGKYTYEFVGWDRELTNISEDTITYPVFAKTLRTFNVVFRNYDNQFLERQEVIYGGSAHFTGKTPIKIGDDFSTYKFIGWDKDLHNITEDTIFKPKYELFGSGGEGVEQLALIYYYNYDGTLLDRNILARGEQSFYYGSDDPPLRPSDAERDYIFEGWDIELDLLTVEASPLFAFAEYRTSAGEIIVTYRDSQHNLLYEDFIMPGDSSEYRGELYDYLLGENGFTGWSKPLMNVSESMTVYPVFREVEDD